MSKLVKSEGSDLDKVFAALSFLGSVRSIDDVFAIFGVQNLPTAQKYGIMFGCAVFTVTIGTVLTLLVMGGSFKRLAEQAQTGEGSIPDSVEERVGRPLLLERLLEAQERLLKKYPAEKTSEKMTPLNEMLLNIAPDVAKAKEVMLTLVDDEKGGKTKNKTAKEQLKQFIPDGYEENYVKAYRKCQDKPGGELSNIVSFQYSFWTSLHKLKICASCCFNNRAYHLWIARGTL